MKSSSSRGRFPTATETCGLGSGPTTCRWARPGCPIVASSTPSANAVAIRRRRGSRPSRRRPGDGSVSRVHWIETVLTSLVNGCVGQDLNLRTSTGQRPQRCAVDLAWQPTRDAPIAAPDINLRGEDAASNERIGCGTTPRISKATVPDHGRRAASRARFANVLSPGTGSSRANVRSMPVIQERAQDTMLRSPDRWSARHAGQSIVR